MRIAGIVCAALAASGLAALGGCTTVAESNPARTATEQMLISTAADRAAERIAPKIPYGSQVFVDGSNFEGTDSKYALGAIRTSLLKRGARLVDDKKAAQVIVEARAGALSTDRKSFLIGIPEFNVPIPFTSGPLSFPEIALYKTEDQKGIAKFAVTGVDAKKGTLIDAEDPQYGYSNNKKTTILVFVSWTDMDAAPKEDNEMPFEHNDGDKPQATN